MEPLNNHDEEQRQIDELYRSLNEEETENYLEDMEKRTICDTPLHVAAAAGMSRWALEVANLKPSLARKLNHEGLSPMHLALRHGHVQTVRALIAFDSSLIRVKGRGLVTPLHYAAEMEETELLAEFLSTCPSSIEDLTYHCETVMHVAVKNRRLNACKVLFGWMRRTALEEILRWKDGDGNTVLHIATLTNQPKVMKLLIGHVKVNAKNFQGLTALDLHHQEGDLQDVRVKKILLGAKAKRASEVSDSMTGAGYLSRTRLSSMEWRDRLLGLTNSHRGVNSANDLRNMLLVVAVLIATATYQGVLSPPRGYWQDDSANSTTPITSISNAPAPATLGTSDIKQHSSQSHVAGKMILDGRELVFFTLLNSGAFVASMILIAILLLGLPMAATVTASSLFIWETYVIALWSAMPGDKHSNSKLRALMLLAGFTLYGLPRVLYCKQCKLMSKLDTPRRRIGRFI